MLSTYFTVYIFCFFLGVEYKLGLWVFVLSQEGEIGGQSRSIVILALSVPINVTCSMGEQL